ncbi:MAG: Rieske (2Fe-2S) protein, partial [Candidatus Uhrbacteria bacterium]|nr:Rieske (2Fe-2S) protein [Candidatus Uhrbacteria bacterium]
MVNVRKLFIAKRGEIPEGRTKSFRFGIANGIAFNDRGTIKAYINRCTHMGGPVELMKSGQRFRCRWHQAEFDPVTGLAIEGEAPKGTSLTPIELLVEDDQIFGVLSLP